MPKLRLIKVLVQPVFVLDDGETITEIEHPATAIPASEWPTYSSERFPKELEAWQAQLDETPAVELDTLGAAGPTPNRAARRAKTKKR